MKTYKETKQITATAVAQVNEVSHNIMYYVRALNALAAKNDFCDGVKVLDLGVLCQELLTADQRKRMKCGQLFSAYLFKKDSKGRACIVKVSKRCPRFGLDLYSVNENGWQYLAPITLTLAGVCRAFKYVVDSAAKAKETEAKKANKSVKTIKGVANMLAKALKYGIITEEEYEAQMRAKCAS